MSGLDIVHIHIIYHKRKYNFIKTMEISGNEDTV